MTPADERSSTARGCPQAAAACRPPSIAFPHEHRSRSLGHMASSDSPAPSMTAALYGVRLPDVTGYTTADLHALPEDGRRWELIDGSLIVSPSATIDHNAIARWIAQILEDSCPHSDMVVGTDQ